jgi:hypothetical protein
LKIDLEMYRSTEVGNSQYRIIGRSTAVFLAFLRQGGAKRQLLNNKLYMYLFAVSVMLKFISFAGAIAYCCVSLWINVVGIFYHLYLIL